MIPISLGPLFFSLLSMHYPGLVGVVLSMYWDDIIALLPGQLVRRLPQWMRGEVDGESSLGGSHEDEMDQRDGNF